MAIASWSGWQRAAQSPADAQDGKDRRQGPRWRFLSLGSANRYLTLQEQTSRNWIRLFAHCTTLPARNHHIEWKCSFGQQRCWPKGDFFPVCWHVYPTSRLTCFLKKNCVWHRKHRKNDTLTLFRVNKVYADDGCPFGQKSPALARLLLSKS
jgi:hypothetical protein